MKAEIIFLFLGVVFLYWFILLVLAVEKSNKLKELSNRINDAKLGELIIMNKILVDLEDTIRQKQNQITGNPLESHSFKFMWMRVKKFFNNIEQSLEDKNSKFSEEKNNNAD